MGETSRCKSLQYAALNPIYFGQAGFNKICYDATISWLPNTRADMKNEALACSTCLNAGKNPKFQLGSTKK